jgi:ArsR family transcriptional regulator, arsenate/arsenite/antimonite-responsive transcriptional repressor
MADVLALLRSQAGVQSPHRLGCEHSAVDIYGRADMLGSAPSIAPRRLEVAAVFRALSDPTRVRILHLLRDGPLCVGDLVSILDVPQPKASRHLEYLRRSRLVQDEKRGLWRFYRLAAARPGFHQKIIELLDAAAADAPKASADEAALRRLRTKGGCCPQHTPKRGKR